MRSFQLLPHTADARLRVTSKTTGELFRFALEGMAHIQKKKFCNQQQGLYFITDLIHVNSPDITSLLIDFLSEILTLSHIRKTVYCVVVINKFSNTEIKATIKGNKVNYFDEDIKAVTYHEAQVKKNQNGHFETTIVFDI